MNPQLNLQAPVMFEIGLYYKNFRIMASKNNIRDIVPGTGLGDIKFGMTRKEVERLAGKPDETEHLPGLDDNPKDDLEVWHYDEYEFSVIFDAEYDWRVVSISLSDPYFHLFGKSIIGMPNDQALSFLKEMDIEISDFEDMSDEDCSDLQKLESDANGLIMWIEEGRVCEIQMVPEMEDDGETYKWPE